MKVQSKSLLCVPHQSEAVFTREQNVPGFSLLMWWHVTWCLPRSVRVSLWYLSSSTLSDTAILQHCLWVVTVNVMTCWLNHMDHWIPAIHRVLYNHRTSRMLSFFMVWLMCCSTYSLAADLKSRPVSRISGWRITDFGLIPDTRIIRLVFQWLLNSFILCVVCVHCAMVVKHRTLPVFTLVVTACGKMAAVICLQT